MHQLSGRTTPERQFDALLAAEPARPFVTYYDEASGERSELSAKSMANWVAKTHHLLAGELGLGVGDRALVALPAHWISVPVLLGCFTAGLELVTGGPAEVAFVGPDTISAAGGVADVYAIAPLAAAVGWRGDPPPRSQDYVAAVRPQPDAWATVHMPAGPEDPALPGLRRGDLAERGAALGLAPGARVLTARAWEGPNDWIETVLAPVAARGSVVLVANCQDAAVLDRRAQQERATVRL